MNNYEALCYQYLKEIYGPNATFREGQLEAILSVINGKRTLVVQKTGWGKSLVYFLATKILRDQGAGICLVVSPLLALMNNQIESASFFKLKANAINSNNRDEWNEIQRKLFNNELDVLFISPERLANNDFNEKVLNKIADKIGMLVIDEAHCISDWGHDFRPDYRRITNIINFLPPTVPLLCTTATANNRVVDDICFLLKENITVSRGSLARSSINIQIIKMSQKEKRLAWLAQNISQLQGTGIVYCLTIADCEMVTNWLRLNNINAYTYTGQIDANARKNLETMFINNEMKVLVATIAFGMGVDKPDISFVIHYQKPGNVVSYYQQIGRAGRNIKLARAILFVGLEDDYINNYFINAAFPTLVEMEKVIRVLINNDGLRLGELETKINLSNGRLKKTLLFLIVNGDISMENNLYYKTPRPWSVDLINQEKITYIRNNELNQMNNFVNTNDCYMKFITNELNDINATDCGHCANCNPNLKLSEDIDDALVNKAINFLQKESFIIKPRSRWPATVKIYDKNIINKDNLLQQGYALSGYSNAGWGKLVIEQKAKKQSFSNDLVNASYHFIKDYCKEWEITWITSVPSIRNPNLVRDFAITLSKKLNIPYFDSINKTRDAIEQKYLQNSYQQCSNAWTSFEVTNTNPGNVLLIDDTVKTRWTMTILAYKLTEKGSGKVFPYVLTNTSGGIE